MFTCTVQKNHLATAVHVYEPTDISRPTVLVIAEAPVGTNVYFARINERMQNAWVCSSDMPWGSRMVPLSSNGEKVRESHVLLTQLVSRLPGLTTRQHEGVPKNACNLGLSFDQIAQRMAWWDLVKLGFSNKKTRALLSGDGVYEHNRRFERVNNLLCNVLKVDRLHGQDELVKKASLFANNVRQFLEKQHETDRYMPDVTMVVRVEHFLATSRLLRSIGYKLGDSTWEPCAEIV